jgi:hypothetical protein
VGIAAAVFSMSLLSPAAHASAIAPLMSTQ